MKFNSIPDSKLQNQLSNFKFLIFIVPILTAFLIGIAIVLNITPDDLTENHKYTTPSEMSYAISFGLMGLILMLGFGCVDKCSNLENIISTGKINYLVEFRLNNNVASALVLFTLLLMCVPTIPIILGLNYPNDIHRSMYMIITIIFELMSCVMFYIAGSVKRISRQQLKLADKLYKG